MSKKSKVNRHGDHIASCLCCIHAQLGYEGRLSDVTPGEGWYCYCTEGHFYDLTDSYNDLHKLQELAPHCPDFAYEYVINPTKKK